MGEAADIDQLARALEAAAHRNGRLEAGQRFAEWLQRNRHRLPPDVRSEMAEFLMREIT